MMFQLLLEPLFLKGFLTGVLVLVVLEVVAIVWMVDRWLSLAAPACSTYPSKRRGSLTVHDNLEFYIAKAAEKEKEDDRGGASGQTTTGDYPGSLGSETTANTTPTSSTSSTTASKHPKNHPKIPHSHTEPWPKEVVEFLSNKLDPQDQSYKCDHHSSSTSSSSSSSSGDSDSSDNNSNNTKSNTSPTPKFASRSSKVWDLAGGGAAGVNKDRTVSSSSTNPLLPTHLSTTEHEKCQWLNILLHRFFLEVRASELYKWKMKRRITAKMNQRLKGNAFISQFRLTDFSLGCHVPYVSGVRIVKGWTEDLAVVCEADLEYKGGCSFSMAVNLVGGYEIPFKITLNGLAGRIRVRVPSPRYPDMMSIAFVENPGATFDVTSSALWDSPRHSILPSSSTTETTTLTSISSALLVKGEASTSIASSTSKPLSRRSFLSYFSSSGSSITTASTFADTLPSDVPLVKNASATTVFISNLVRGLLARVVTKIFNEQWVLPSFRNFYLPMLNPYDALGSLHHGPGQSSGSGSSSSSGGGDLVIEGLDELRDG